MDRDSSTDLVVREGSNVTLHCHAVGHPEPYVMWRREDGDDINYNGDIGEEVELENDGPNSVVDSFICS